MHPAGIMLAVLLLAVLLALFRSEWEKRSLSVETYEIRTDKLREGARFVFLTDMHSASFGENNCELLHRIDGLSPDAVLIGGDMITCGKRTPVPPKTDVCLHLLEQLSERYRIYYAEGNHETRMKERFPDTYKMFTDHLMQLGVEYLCNDTEIFDTEDLIEDEEDDIVLSGVSLEQKFFNALKPGFGRREAMPDGYLEQKIGTPDKWKFNILLLHSPLYFQEACAWGADLVLSGHFHGGTIRLPFVGGVMTPQYQFFIRQCAGRFDCEHASMIVSRGLGTHSIRIRFNNLPEISLIKVIPDIV
ncbi:MAG: metallophosphoesterase [Eubacteriales bacterium]|nr:metallophosphoesterase [Eubacteriales bacterium]